MFQPPLFKPKSDWLPPKMGSLPTWEGAQRIGLDIETHDPTIKELGPGPRRNGYICGVSFKIEDGPGYYLPIRHPEDNLPREGVLAYLRDQAKSFSGEIVGANLTYDLDFLTEEQVLFTSSSVKFRDVQIADPLINELQDSYSLQNIALRYGLEGKSEGLLRDAAEEYGIDPKKGLWQLPARFVGEYAVQDANLPLAILRKQEVLLAEQKLERIWELETKLLPVLVKMRARGVRISEEKLDAIERWALAEEQQCLGKIKHLTGIAIAVGGVWQAKVLATVLAKIGVVVKRTAKGAPNIDKDVLDNIDHPVAETLAWARKTNKLRTTFAQSVRNHMVRGRIHCVFNQLARESEDGKGIKGARYGRLSSEHPNIQQQPSRDEFAKRWRSIYIPEEGELWCSADYSQQEPRMTTHYAVKADCTRAEVAAEKYRNDPKTDNHQMMADLTGLPRKQAKDIYLGLCYNMGGAKLSDELGLPTKIIQHHKTGRMIRVAGEEAQIILDKFNSEAPFIKELAQKCERLAQKRGYILTLLGRRCHFPKDAEGNYDWTHRALNRLIQGSSADQTKQAMVMAEAAGFKLRLQVHDELDLSVKNKEEAEGLADIMRNCVPLEVPSRVDVELGPSWGEAE